jgi:hypothetical protein
MKYESRDIQLYLKIILLDSKLLAQAPLLVDLYITLTYYLERRSTIRHYIEG